MTEIKVSFIQSRKRNGCNFLKLTVTTLLTFVFLWLPYFSYPSICFVLKSVQINIVVNIWVAGTKKTQGIFKSRVRLLLVKTVVRSLENRFLYTWFSKSPNFFSIIENTLLTVSKDTKLSFFNLDWWDVRFSFWLVEKLSVQFAKNPHSLPNFLEFFVKMNNLWKKKYFKTATEVPRYSMKYCRCYILKLVKNKKQR